ncbi:MAG: GNAT family N-acetyltransferase [Puniceicoccales bacterium]|jgi:GNAT superfamily N-acetyltransferase|nr:GNAT family N-acetyltransferase [Puniceicoccales bacterium]
MSLDKSRRNNIRNNKKISLEFVPNRPERSFYFSVGDEISLFGNMEYEEKYAFCVWIDIYKNQDVERGPKVARIVARMFDAFGIADIGDDIVDIADMISGDTELCVNRLVNWDVYKEAENDCGFWRAYVCYLEELYVYPKYRRKGIGRYLLSKLPELLEYSFNLEIRAIVCYLSPRNMTCEEMPPAEEEEMLQIMRKLYLSNRFVPLDPAQRTLALINEDLE